MIHRREVSTEEGVNLAEEWGIPFIECSAKKNESVNSVFTTIMMEIESDSKVLEVSDSNCVIM